MQQRLKTNSNFTTHVGANSTRVSLTLTCFCDRDRGQIAKMRVLLYSWCDAAVNFENHYNVKKKKNFLGQFTNCSVYRRDIKARAKYNWQQQYKRWWWWGVTCLVVDSKGWPPHRPSSLPQLQAPGNLRNGQRWKLKKSKSAKNGKVRWKILLFWNSSSQALSRSFNQFDENRAGG